MTKQQRHYQENLRTGFCTPTRYAAGRDTPRPMAPGDVCAHCAREKDRHNLHYITYCRSFVPFLVPRLVR